MADLIKISDSVDTESSVIAASLSAVKKAYDKALEALNGIKSTILSVNGVTPDSDGNIVLSKDNSGYDFVTTAGEFTLNNCLRFKKSEAIIGQDVTYIAMRSHNGDTSASVVCCGLDHDTTPGAIWLQARNNENSNTLYYYPDGRFYNTAYNANIAYAPKSFSGVGQFVFLSAYKNSGSGITLPSGGQWAYFNCWTHDTETLGSGGIAAGGTQVSSPSSYANSYGWAWRIS